MDGDIRAPSVKGRFVGRWEREERVLPGRAGPGRCLSFIFFLILDYYYQHIII